VHPPSRAPPGRQSRPNLYRIFWAKEAGTLFIAAEWFGLPIDDGGQSLQMIQTGQRGSLWTGLALRDGSLLVAGLNARCCAAATAAPGQRLPSGVEGSITDLAQDRMAA